MALVRQAPPARSEEDRLEKAIEKWTTKDGLSINEVLWLLPQKSRRQIERTRDLAGVARGP